MKEKIKNEKIEIINFLLIKNLKLEGSEINQITYGLR